jgi:hypothetical protein
MLTPIRILQGHRATARALSNLGKCPRRTVSTQAGGAASIPATRSTRQKRYAVVVVRSFRTALKPPATPTAGRQSGTCGLRPVPPSAVPMCPVDHATTLWT